MWVPLGPFARFFLLLLALVAVRTVYFALVVLVRLQSLQRAENENSSQKSLALLNHRAANSRQTILAMFYLFGLTFFLQIQSAFWTPENDRPVGLMVLENFRVYFRCAAAIFFCFFVLQLVQWFVTARIRKASRRPDTQAAR